MNLAPVPSSERRTLGDLRAAPVRFKATAHELGGLALCGPDGANDSEVAARVYSIARAAIARGVEAFRASTTD